MERLWQNGDTISLDMEIKLITHTLNGKVAYTYGCLTLASDEAKQIGVIPNDELYRTVVKINDKDTLLSDYASCDKNWNQDLSKVQIYLQDDN